MSQQDANIGICSSSTLPAEMFGGTEFWLYTIIIIKIESNPF